MKKLKRKKFVPWCPTHIYQKGYQGRVLFYCVRDRLLYLSIFFDESRKHRVGVLSIVLMFNHVHATIRVRSEAGMAAFNQAVESRYALAFNQVSGRSGPVFMRTYGWAQKRSDRDVKDNLCYLANNPVVKKLCKSGVDNLWTLLAYGRRRYPFSEPLALSRASRRMRRSVAMVNECLSQGALSYQILNQVFKGLTRKECRQLVDHIVQKCSTVDYNAAAEYFGGFERMLAAFDLTTGSEHEISEEFVPEPDGPYAEMAKLMGKEGYDLVEKKFLSPDLDEDERLRLVRLLSVKTHASYRQIARFLYVEDK